MVFLSLASLAALFSRRMQIWILIKKTSGIEVSCVDGKQSAKQLYKLVKSFFLQGGRPVLP